jgi:hypothetical protein
LSYDYQAVRDARFMEFAQQKGGGISWAPTSGPDADFASELVHMKFDKLAGIDPVMRTREDRLPRRLLATIEKCLVDGGADDLADWSHAHLAHADDQTSREAIAHLNVTANKITDAIRVLARATEVTAWLLYAGGRAGSLMPVVQFNPFERLDKPNMQAGGEAAAWGRWHELSAE